MSTTPFSNVKFTVLYNSKDISTSINKYLLGVVYVDNTEGHSDTIDIHLDDSDQLWQNSWYPQKGATIQCFITQDNFTLDLGTFKIDEVEQSAPPDEFIIKAIATISTGSLRTRKSSSHESKTLQEIVQTIAQNNGLTVEGKFDQSIILNHSTQNRETDLEYLHRISYDYGYVFSIRDTVITFYNIFDLENIEPVATFDKTDLSRYRIKDKSIGTFTQAVNNYQDPVSGGTITGTATQQILNEDNVSFNIIDTNDQLIVTTKAENNQQANAKTKALLYRKNSFQQEGFADLPGSIYAVAGNNVNITSIGQISGVYHIFTSTHRIDKHNGYSTNVKFKRVGFVQKVYSKRPKKPRKYTISVVN